VLFNLVCAKEAGVAGFGSNRNGSFSLLRLKGQFFDAQFDSFKK